MVRFTNSGTEACMGVLRLMRAYTKREKVIKFEGCYHGHADSFLVAAGSGVITLGLPDSPGARRALLPRPCAPTLCPDPVPRPWAPTLGPDLLPRPCAPTFCPDPGPRPWAPTLLALTSHALLRSRDLARDGPPRPAAEPHLSPKP
jgi:hypothetical protein